MPKWIKLPNSLCSNTKLKPYIGSKYSVQNILRENRKYLTTDRHHVPKYMSKVTYTNIIML